jgi:hypothetical protein
MRLADLIIAENPIAGNIPSAKARESRPLQLVSFNLSYTQISGELTADLSTNWPYLRSIIITATQMRSRDKTLPSFVTPIANQFVTNLVSDQTCCNPLQSRVPNHIT